MAFQVGDKVIYPNHGLGVIQQIETKTIMGTTCGFYYLRMANETTVLVPDGMNESSELTLTNELGQTVLHKFIAPSENAVSLKVHDLPAGFYQINLKSRTNSFSATVVKN